MRNLATVRVNFGPARPSKVMLKFSAISKQKVIKLGHILQSGIVRYEFFVMLLKGQITRMSCFDLGYLLVMNVTMYHVYLAILYCFLIVVHP